MTTNGQLLTEERLRKLSRMKCIVAFSLSGTSPDTYSFNREGGDLDKVKQALARARELELESANPSQFPFRRKIHFLIMRRNMAELPEAVRWAAKYGAMELILKPMDNWDLPPELWEAENPLNHREELRRGLEEAQKLGRELGVSIVAPEIAAEKPKTAATGATQAKGWLRLFQTDEITRRGYPRFEDRFCDFPFQTMYFHVDGKVSVCCAAQWHPERLGDLGRRSLPAIWNGWGYRRLRSGMLIGSHKPYCRACPLPNGLGRGNPLG
jgi:MoaA/NifB/PqqE/SkfB family radical SAM enzyme